LVTSDPLEEREPPETSAAQPQGFRLPQIIVEGVLRRSLKADIITFKLRLLRLIELSFVVTVPAQGKTKAPVYVRFWVDRSQEDKPGTISIG
jgi:hypothetical protein